MHVGAQEQLVDVPLPQIAEKIAVLQEDVRRFCREQNALEEEEEVEEDEDDEEEEVSRFLPHFRPRLWCRFVLAGSICHRGWQCTFAHLESELHPDSW